MYRNNKTSIIGIVITIIVLIILVLLTNINTNKLTGAENLFSKLVMPVQNGLTHLKNKIANLLTVFGLKLLKYIHTTCIIRQVQSN